MIYLTYSLIIPVVLLLGAVFLHNTNLNGVHKRIEVLKGGIGSVSKEDFYREITVAQGMNFTALAIAAWMMLFVAIAYFYLLIPTALPYSYMMLMPEWASHPLGFSLFGIIFALLAGGIICISDLLPESWRNLKLTELYSFYSIPKSMKRNIGLTIPLLAISIVFSAYMGTLYPENNNILIILSCLFIVVSICILVWPIWEGRK